MSKLPVKPKFEIEAVQGTRTISTFKYNKQTLENGNVIYEREELIREVPNGYMVYNARGDSVHVSEKELRRLGLDKPPTLIDEDGNEMPMPRIGGLKQAALAKASKR